MSLYSRDAVFAARKIHAYIITNIEEAILDTIFGTEWLHKLTHNDLALAVVRTVEDYMDGLQLYLSSVMLGKMLDALVQSVVLLYSKGLIGMAPKQVSSKKSIWKKDNQKALDRTAGDIAVMKNYFDCIAEEKSTYPTLAHAVESRFEFLYILYELLSIATGCSSSTIHDFVQILHKYLLDFQLTKRVVGDLVHLVNPEMEKRVYEIVDSIQHEPLLSATSDNAADERAIVPGLCLQKELTRVCNENDKLRIRPGLKMGTAADQAHIMLNMWSSRSTHYRQEATKSIQKRSTEYGRNMTQTIAAMSKAGTRP